jgi:hypothetical protein
MVLLEVLKPQSRSDRSDAGLLTDAGNKSGFGCRVAAEWMTSTLDARGTVAG